MPICILTSVARVLPFSYNCHPRNVVLTCAVITWLVDTVSIDRIISHWYGMACQIQGMNAMDMLA